MADFLSDLRAKAGQVRDWYRNLCDDKSAHGPIKMTEKEKEMFDSCERWHKNRMVEDFRNS